MERNSGEVLHGFAQFNLLLLAFLDCSGVVDDARFYSFVEIIGCRHTIISELFLLCRCLNLISHRLKLQAEFSRIEIALAAFPLEVLSL